MALNEKLAQFERDTSNQLLVYVDRTLPPDSTIDEVWVGGRRSVVQGHHALADTARQRFVAARARLLQAG